MSLPRTMPLLAIFASLLPAACGTSDDKPAPLNMWYAPCASDAVKPVTITEAMDLVAARKGDPSLIMLYFSGCPLAESALPGLAGLQEKYKAQGLAVFALGYDECRAHVSNFLGDAGLSLTPYYLLPWKSGEVKAAVESIGAEYSPNWPVIILVGREGKAVRQWERISDEDIPDIEQALQD